MNKTPSSPLEWILAIDPGETTGIVVAKRTAPREFVVTRADDVPWEHRWHIPDMIIGAGYDTVVIEDFRLYHHSRVSQVNSDFPTVRMIGYVEYALHRNGKQAEPVKQPASIMKSVQILEEHKVHFEGLHHARSAYKHLRYYVLMTQGNYK